MHLTTVQFPDIHLETRDGHKLRGFFGKLFKDHSELLHNHFADGKSMYVYPLVQYKIIDSIPTLIGINEGGKLLTELFLKIKTLVIDDKEYEIFQKNIKSEEVLMGSTDKLIKYEFKTLWMALNQDNYRHFLTVSRAEQESLLNKVLIGNILSFHKGVQHFLTDRIMVNFDISDQIYTKYKNQKMTAFKGTFVTNCILPDNIGLGKSVSRGYGTIQCIKSKD